MTSPSRLITVTRIAARVCSLLLFIFWGSFFIEHMTWFVASREPTPPLRIWLLQFGHFILIAGYLVLLRWEKTGGVMIVISAVLFFSFAAGERALPYIIISILPALLIAYCRWAEKKVHPLPVVL